MVAPVMLSHRIIPGAIVGAFWCAMILCSVVSSWNAFERFEQRHPVPGLPKGESPSRAGFSAQGRWCLAPVPAWARVAMDDARTLPTRGARCPVWTAKPPAVDPRQVSLLEIKG